MPLYQADALADFAAALLEAAGLASERAQTVGQILLEGDLLGHDTHGLALLAPYAEELLAGRMTAAGEPEIVSDRGPTVAWHGKRLPGPWLTVQGIALAEARAKQYGQCSVSISHSHHIACLAAYLEQTARRGFLVLLTCSDPNVAAVAPYGGSKPVFTPNPIAAAWPTQGDPVILDISASVTTMGQVQRHHREGRLFEKPWLLDEAGRPSADPAVMLSGAKGSIQPLGGLDAGHKGFALALLIEALTSGLGGFGRADPPEGWGASVFIQVFDPAAFGGAAAFVRETGAVAALCRASPPGDPARPVRLPGERGLALKARQLAQGVALQSDIMPALKSLATRLGVPMPAQP